MTAIQFQQQVVNLQENMYNFARILTANRHDAEDLLQETTLKVLKCQHMYLDNTNFKGWVLTIMRNIFINEYRKEVRNKVAIDLIDDSTSISLPTELSNTNTAEEILSVKEIIHVINALENKLRNPLLMSMSGYRYDEISRNLRISIGTVKSRIHLARKEVQKNIEKYDYLDEAV